MKTKTNISTIIFQFILAFACLGIFILGIRSHFRYALLFLIAAIFFIPTKRNKWITISKYIIILVLLGIQGYQIYHFQANDSGKITVSFLAVGHGDASIIHNDTNQAIMIDIGPKDTYDTVLDYCHNNHIYSIDALFLTHPHEDHVGALRRVGDEITIQKIYVPKILEELTENVFYYRWIKEYCETKGIEYEEIDDHFACEINHMYIQNYNPVNAITSSDLNQYSLVLKVTYNQKNILYTGDAGWHAEYQILENTTKLDSDILKVGHHGSYDSTSSELLRTVNPSYAVISVSNQEEFTLPNPDVINRLEGNGIMVYRTDQMGTISFEITDNHIIVLNH